MKSAAQKLEAPECSARRSPWKLALGWALLTVAMAATPQVQAKKPPPLFAEEMGQPHVELPAQAIAGKSRAVKINHANLRAGKLSLSLPGGLTVGAMRDRQEDMGNGRFAWVGHAVGNRSERVIIGVSGDAVAGTFVRKGKLFKLEPRADGSHVLSEVGTGAPAPEADPIPVTAPVTESVTAPDQVSSGGLTPGAGVATDPGQQIIDVMVVYTPKVEQIYGTAGAEALIIQAVAETNQAYANSGINPRLNLVHSARTNYTESGDISTDLSRLRATADGYMDELHTMRDNYGADLVTLIGDALNYCGFAYRMTNLSASFASSAFSVVHRSCATGHYSFAHELGHNQGAHHDPDNGSGAIYTYAHGYRDPLNKFRTVMAFNCSSNCTRVGHFSNPDILYNGTPTGDAVYSNNARTLNNTAATVAGFRAQAQQQPPQAPYGLDAAATSASEIQLSWVDASANETGFYLERSGANQNFSQIASLPANTTSYLDGNLQADTLYYYRTRAFNSAGSSSYSDTAITATDPAPERIPNAPSSLNGVAAGTDSISLTWIDNSDNESGFTLERSLNGSSGWATIATLGANTKSYLNTGLQAATTYYYRVNAFNAVGQSAYSVGSTSTDPLLASKFVRQRDLFR